MKLLIMCEGPNELKIINILLENQKLKFSSDDLLGLVPYHARQIKSSAAVKAALNLYPDEVHVLRIGDGQNEKLEIPSAYKDKITLVEKYCTKPELEMLLIISENLAAEYEKVKSKTKPKTFAKANIRCGRRRYDNSTAFYEEYFGPDCEKLVKVMDDKARNNYLRDYEMFTALVEQVSEGIFGFSSEEAYQRELNKENHPSKKRKKFGRR